MDVGGWYPRWFELGRETQIRLTGARESGPRLHKNEVFTGGYRRLMGKDTKEHKSVKLNLGCGRRILEGYTNVDLPGNHSGIKPDVEADLRKLPFPDEHADEIMAVHVIEHFYVWEVMSVLDEWKRVLKTGGKIILELPNLMSILKFFSHF